MIISNPIIDAALGKSAFRVILGTDGQNQDVVLGNSADAGVNRSIAFGLVAPLQATAIPDWACDDGAKFLGQAAGESYVFFKDPNVVHFFDLATSLGVGCLPVNWAIYDKEIRSTGRTYESFGLNGSSLGANNANDINLWRLDAGSTFMQAANQIAHTFSAGAMDSISNAGLCLISQGGSKEHYLGDVCDPVFMHVSAPIGSDCKVNLPAESMVDFVLDVVPERMKSIDTTGWTSQAIAARFNLEIGNAIQDWFTNNHVAEPYGGLQGRASDFGFYFPSSQPSAFLNANSPVYDLQTLLGLYQSHVCIGTLTIVMPTNSRGLCRRVCRNRSRLACGVVAEDCGNQ